MNLASWRKYNVQNIKKDNNKKKKRAKNETAMASMKPYSCFSLPWNFVVCCIKCLNYDLVYASICICIISEFVHVYGLLIKVKIKKAKI